MQQCDLSCKPGLIHVLLRYEQGGITVIVEDDGTGFDVHILDERPRDDNSGVWNVYDERTSIFIIRFDTD